MAVSKPTIATDATAAGKASVQTATDTLCGYIDTTNANVDTNTAAIAALQLVIKDLRRKLRAAGVF